MNINRIIHVAGDAGKIILQSGGETYRVEETIIRVCNALGLKEAESYVTPTGIMISVTDENGKTISLIKRVLWRGINLEKISRVNNLSREISLNKLSLEEVEMELKKIESSKIYSDKIMIIFASLAAGFFTLLFGGSFRDFLVTFFTGIVIKSMALKLNSLEINDFFINTIGGSIAAILALISVQFGLATNIDKIIIGSIMLLVPGLAITNAIRDTIEGDLVSGMARTIDAFFTAIAIAIGTGIVMKIWFLVMGVTV